MTSSDVSKVPDGPDHEHEDGGGDTPTAENTAVSGEGSAGQATLSVPEMDCPSCVGKVESSVRELNGVEDIDPHPTSGRLVVEYDTGATTGADVAERVEAAGYSVASAGLTEVTLDVPEMDCPSCASTVESALTDVASVRDMDTRPTSGTVVVSFDSSTAETDAVVEAVESAGYPVVGVSGEGVEAAAEGADDRPDVFHSGRAYRTAVGAVLLAGGLVLTYLVDGSIGGVTVGSVEFVLADALFLVAVALAGQEILRGGYYSARTPSLDIDFLMSAAIVAAIAATLLSPAAHLYSEAATLAVLFSVAELLERYAMEEARDSLRELMELSPDEATVERDGDEVTVPVDDVDVGEILVVRPGEKIPLDGTVVAGESAVNQAPVTGESVPVDKTTDDEVYAGTVNEGGYLEVEVTSRAGEDTLSQIIDLVENAESAKTDREQFVERFADYYTPVMVALAVLVAVVPPLVLGAPWVTWFVAGITMLVLACPCAFVISTPVTVVSGITSAAKHGVLIKGGSHLEAMGRVDAVAVDKTGTLTKGELTVTDVVPVGDRTEADVLRCARGLEERSEHPISAAIVGHAEQANVTASSVEDFEALTGEGVRATLEGDVHYAGKPGLFDDLGFDLEHVHVVSEDPALQSDVRDRCDRQGCLNLAEDTIPRLQSEGKTVVLVGQEDELEGLVAVADEIRPEARRAVERLHDLGVEVAMVTGDNKRTARAIADQLGIDSYRAGLMPEEKVAAVESLQEEFGEVAMVGDGINDAPALASAEVGIAMGAAGTDTALETADIALLGDDLSRLPYLYELAHDANGVIRQNIWASLAIKAVLAVGVPLQLVTVAIAVLVGDAGMTIGVTGNAMRLSRIRPETEGVGGGDTAGIAPSGE